MNDDDLNWRVEKACREAWPAAAETTIDGWLLRQSGGTNRRTNSVNPLNVLRSNPDLAVESAEAFYMERGQTPLFRVPGIANEMDSVLDRLNYQTEGGTIHLFGDISELACEGDSQVVVASEPSEDWLKARFHIASVDEADQAIYRRMTGVIGGQKAFASVAIDGRIASAAYAVVHDGLLVFESVATDAEFRQRGLAYKTVSSLMEWGRRAGAAAGCLQVVADNLPARALYASLGLRRELYRYHYRRKTIAS